MSDPRPAPVNAPLRLVVVSLFLLGMSCIAGAITLVAMGNEVPEFLKLTATACVSAITGILAKPGG